MSEENNARQEKKSSGSGDFPAAAPLNMAANLLPPQNIEVEEAILGGILLDPEAYSRVAELLVPKAFYIPAHGHIYQAAIDLHTNGKPTDLLNVSNWLADNQLLDKIGGQAKLVQLVERTVSAVNVDALAVLLMDKFMRRELIQAGNTVGKLGYDTSQSLENVLDQAEQQVLNVTQVRPQSGLTPVSEIVMKTYEDIEARNQELTPPGLTCDFADLDAMTGGFQRSDLIVLAGRPSMGKCLSTDAEIVLDDGSVRTIGQLYQDRRGSLLTLQNNWQFAWTEPSAYVDDGIKPVFRVRTSLGKSIETTLTHPFLTMDGWQPLSNLQVGDRIAVPRIIPIFGQQVMDITKVKLLAYLIGDGCLTQGTPRFTNVNPRIKAEFEEAVLNGEELVDGGWQAMSSGNALTHWLRSLGIFDKSAHYKFVPECIFTLQKPLVACFINRLFATDGWASVLASGQAQLGFASVSERLVQQIQHLLLRFGIIARLKFRSVKYRQERRSAWQLDITDAKSIATFIEEIGIFGKEEAISKVKEAIEQKRYQSNRDHIPKQIWSRLDEVRGQESWKSLATRAGLQGTSNIHVGQRALSRDRLSQLATALADSTLQSLATSQVYWDEIREIEFVGHKQVYDLTVPKTHNFVANDLCVHNTAITLNIAYNMSILHKLPILVFSLEMSKEQLVQRMLAGEARIDSNRLRAGRISQNEWEQVYAAIAKIADLPIYIDDTPNMMVMQMRSQARRLQAETGKPLGLIMLDYLQLMEGSSDNRVQEISKITRSLKGLARELNVPIIALSQLSRSVEARNNKRPMMSDLRESGSIEQDADLVIMLYRDAYYNPDTPDRDITELIITKHRNGPTGVVKLVFDPALTKFKNLAQPGRG
jgi:replicative DNA helicase